ncbi:histone-lysine N-methyltransferase SETMAR-like [Octopus bimaculoides]|uniref:histone-lysine N-methyltransferase SETMAR-like n=1 Tax=Octopus bimaculoides TaxID=37653 RepID=UPI0022E49BCD|nr:histone-lysine N-methyltransferase SETMAR-like [Octopus bimaculoides]
MDSQKLHIHHVLLCLFKKGENTTVTCKIICGVNGEDAVGQLTVRRWFSKFKHVEFSLEDDSRCGRPSTVDDDSLKVTIEENKNIMARELAEKLKVPKSTVHEHLVKIGYASHKMSE